LKPTSGLEGHDMFRHLKFKAAVSPSGKATPSPFLDVEMTAYQREILSLDHQSHLTRKDIMNDAHGEGARIRLAAIKLDHLGNIKAHSGLVNNEGKLQKWRNQVQLAQSVAAITKFAKDEALKKKRDASTELALLSGPAMLKLAAKNGNVETHTMKEIYSILLTCYRLNVDNKNYKKPALVLILRSKIDEALQMLLYHQSQLPMYCLILLPQLHLQRQPWQTVVVR
jgi:hypothetical protein